MSIAVRQLKASLSRVLARAQEGKVIEVNLHNKPIARIVGIPLHTKAIATVRARLRTDWQRYATVEITQLLRE